MEGLKDRWFACRTSLSVTRWMWMFWYKVWW